MHPLESHTRHWGASGHENAETPVRDLMLRALRKITTRCQWLGAGELLMAGGERDNIVPAAMDAQEFEAMLTQIDDDFKSSGVPIPFRPLRAMGEVSKRSNFDVVLLPIPVPAIEGRYDSLTLSAHIEAWFKKRYADRLNTHFGPGSVALLIKGDPWVMVLPRLFGRLQIICDNDLSKGESGNVARRGVIVFNVLNCIQNFPQGLADQLTFEDRQRIATFFSHSLRTLLGLEQLAPKRYANEARGDLEVAVSAFFSKPPQYGQSKWASLQFAEKVLKCFLNERNSTIPHHHDLGRLLQNARAAGLETIDEDRLMSKIQCLPQSDTVKRQCVSMRLLLHIMLR